MSFTRAGDLLGAWHLDSAVEVFDDGERRDEFGSSPEGYLCYQPAGIVSATLGDSARPPVPANAAQLRSTAGPGATPSSALGGQPSARRATPGAQLPLTF